MKILSFYGQLGGAGPQLCPMFRKDRAQDGVLFDITQTKFRTKQLNMSLIVKIDANETWKLQKLNKLRSCWTMGDETVLKRCFSAVVSRFSCTLCYLWTV